MTINPQPLPPELQPQSQNENIPAREEAIVEEPKAEQEGDDMSDLFEVPEETDNDMEVDDLVEPPDEESMDDLVSVSNEDIMGEAPKPKVKSQQFRRTNRRYVPPPSLGGMNL